MEKLMRRYLQNYEKETDPVVKAEMTFDFVTSDLFVREKYIKFLLSTYDSVYSTLSEYKTLLMISKGMNDPNRKELLSDYNKMKEDAKK